MNETVILLVDDHLLTRVSLAKLLVAQGFSVLTAGSAEEGELLVADFPFDLVLTDIGLPEADGWEFLTRVRREQPHLSFIAITGSANEIDNEKSTKAGFVAYLKKPVESGTLVQAIRKALSDKI